MAQSGANRTVDAESGVLQPSSFFLEIEGNRVETPRVSLGHLIMTAKEVHGSCRGQNTGAGGGHVQDQRIARRLAHPILPLVLYSPSTSRPKTSENGQYDESTRLMVID